MEKEYALIDSPDWIGYIFLDATHRQNFKLRWLGVIDRSYPETPHTRHNYSQGIVRPSCWLIGLVTIRALQVTQCNVVNRENSCSTRRLLVLTQDM